MSILCSIDGRTVWEGKGERESKECFFLKDVKEKQRERIETVK